LRSLCLLYCDAEVTLSWEIPKVRICVPIVGKLCVEIFYTTCGSADLAGQTRSSYTPNMRIISVPSVGRVGLKHTLQAFAFGADGVIFVEGDDSLFKEDQVRDYLTQLKKELGAYGVESLRLISITTTLPQYDKILNIFETTNTRISKIGPVKPEVRSKIKEKLSQQ